MNATYFTELYQYNDWANRRVWDCMQPVSDEDYFKDSDYSIGSIFDQLFHTLAVEDWWIGYLITGEAIFPTEEDRQRLRDQQVMRERWDRVDQRNMQYIQSLTAGELARGVRVPWWEEGRTITVSQALTQVANHSTDHRTQAMALLHMLGYEGVSQDYIAFLKEYSESK